MTEAAKTYYQSHSKLNFIGTNGQLKINDAKVLVVGAGGLGCPCLLYLAGCGVGTIGIADFDTVSVTNLHRQIIYNYEDVGQSKVAVAKTRLLQHNPFIRINVHRLQVDETNVLELIEQYDIIVDGTDNFAVRYLINDACVYLNKPLVYGAIYQTEGHVTVFNYQNSATLRCLFAEPDAETYVPNCADVGAYNIITNIIGVMMAGEAIKVILQNPDVLANKLATYNAVSVELKTINYKPNPQSRTTSKIRFEQTTGPIEISPELFATLHPGSYHLIDVREDWERDNHHIGGQHIPLKALTNHNFSELLKNQQIILYCQVGARSQAAAQFMRKLGYTNALSLKGGLNGIG
ncbi:adenylyltransferase/sulfurtransferase [Mucilaginibacter gracilis]|uniref:Adenylyltransferase/sulfurtransferase n=1 Tax=Mucilaginibacter gracilis TaxID=423350 RepID=A0A495J7U2_9SPHI|nr:HesA/MoeB/ThiF family protein [Mucilaginibacter gracilis]RKR84811.1 adenylyltransferase/sulfurtransferase [Mucilaginibacter gracilis]